MRAAFVAVDCGLAELAGDAFAGPLRVASLGVLTEELVVPCLAALAAAHPGLAPEHVNIGAIEASAALVRGQLDVAFHYEAPSVDGIVVDRLGELGASVYCGRGHPLWKVARPSRHEVLRPRVLGPANRRHRPRARRLAGRGAAPISMRITTLRSNIEVSRSGALLTVLPDVLAAPSSPPASSAASGSPDCRGSRVRRAHPGRARRDRRCGR